MNFDGPSQKLPRDTAAGLSVAVITTVASRLPRSSKFVALHALAGLIVWGSPEQRARR